MKEITSGRQAQLPVLTLERIKLSVNAVLLRKCEQLAILGIGSSIYDLELQRALPLGILVCRVRTIGKLTTQPIDNNRTSLVERLEIIRRRRKS